MKPKISARVYNVYHPETGEFLGRVERTASGWKAEDANSLTKGYARLARDAAALLAPVGRSL